MAIKNEKSAGSLVARGFFKKYELVRDVLLKITISLDNDNLEFCLLPETP